MDDRHHDWWSNLTASERAQYRRHEDRLAAKRKLLAEAGREVHQYNVRRWTEQAEYHQRMLHQYQERGAQRAKQGRPPKVTFRDKRIRRRSYQTMQATG